MSRDEEVGHDWGEAICTVGGELNSWDCGKGCVGIWVGENMPSDQRSIYMLCKLLRNYYKLTFSNSDFIVVVPLLL